MAVNRENLCSFAESMANIMRESQIVLDKLLHIVSANSSFYRNFKLSKENTQDRLIYELGNSQWDIPKLRELLEEVIISRKFIEDVEIRHGFESIGEKVMIVSASLFIDERSNSELILLVIEDITELVFLKRKLEEQTCFFNENKRVLDAIMRYVPAGIVLVDKETKITDVSRAIVKIFGVPEEELIGQVEKNVKWGIMDPSTREPLPFQSMPFYKVINEKMVIRDEEYLVIHHGREHLVMICTEPVLDHDGNISGAVSIWYDITKRKSAETALKESEERFRTLADNISQLTWMATPEGEMFWCNKRWRDFTGTTFEQMKCDGWRKIIHPDFVGNIIPSFNNAIKKGIPWENTFQMRSRDGEYRWFLTRVIPVHDTNGIIVRWLGTCTDVTDIRKYQEELQIAAERFRKVISTDIVGIATADAKGSISYVNNYCVKMLGYSREEFESRNLSWIEITPSEFLQNDFKTLDELRLTGAVPPYEKQFIKKDGSRIWVLLAYMLLPEPGEQLFCFVLDITERKRTLAEAQKRSVEVEAVLNSIPDGLVILDSNGSILSINEIASDMFGVPQRSVNWPQNVLIKKLKPESSEGKPLEIEQLPSYRALHGETVHNLVIKLHKEDDNYYWISASASPIHNDGQVNGAIIEFADITAIHNLQEQLADERNFIDAILKSSGALIVVFDKNGIIIRFNRASEILSGYSEQEVINKPFYPLIPPDEHEKVRMVMSRLLNGEVLVENENNWFTKSGDKRFIRWRNTVIINEKGEVSHYVATGIDITDRMLLEEALNRHASELAAANADLESFSYSVSHDLRTPLASINGLSSIMIEDYADHLDEDGRDILQKIQSGTKKMMNLIEDMLSLSRVGRYEMKREDIDLSEMVRKFLEEFKTGSPQRNVDFKVQKDVHVYADSRLVYMAIENLLRNSWKFTSKKPLAVIEFGTAIVGGKDTCFIKDNGIGFDPKYNEMIFEPFKRAPGEKEFGGTGIGLSIVKRVMDRHGGKVWAKGEPGKGVVIFFTL